jgi:excisionase family DNA binding protein
LATTKQAAHALAISERSLWVLAKRGSIPRVRVGSTWRYRWADLEQFAADNLQRGC